MVKSIDKINKDKISKLKDVKSNVSQIVEKNNNKTPLWKTFIKSAIVFLLMTICGTHYISLTRLTDNQIDTLFPDKVKLFPYFIETSNPECPSSNMTELMIGIITEAFKTSNAIKNNKPVTPKSGTSKQPTRARSNTAIPQPSNTTPIGNPTTRKRSHTAGGGLYACPPKPYSEGTNIDDSLTKKKDYLVFPYSMAFDVENPGKKKVLDDSILVQTFGGDSYEKYGTSTLRSYFGSNFAKSMCFMNAGLRAIITNSANLYDSVLILFQFIILGLILLICLFSFLFSTFISSPFMNVCGSVNRDAWDESALKTDSWPFVKNLLISFFFNPTANSIFYLGALFKIIYELYFQQIFLGNFEEIKRVLHCNLPFISLLFPLIFWSSITNDQINDIFGETTYITMGICWLIMAGTAFFNYSSKSQE